MGEKSEAVAVGEGEMIRGQIQVVINHQHALSRDLRR